MHPAEGFIRDVVDFPKPGIVFKDLTPLFREHEAFSLALHDLAQLVDWDGVSVVAGVEARGFIVGAHLAAYRGVGFVPIRKPGKLPAETIDETYDLEYGTDSLQMHVDALREGERVVLVDDLLATGGTAAAARRLIERGRGRVASAAFLVELDFLPGRDQLSGIDVQSLIHVSGD